MRDGIIQETDRRYGMRVGSLDGRSEVRIEIITPEWMDPGLIVPYLEEARVKMIRFLNTEHQDTVDKALGLVTA